MKHGKPYTKAVQVAMAEAKARSDQERRDGREKLRATYPDIAGFIDSVEVDYGETTGIVKKK